MDDSYSHDAGTLMRSNGYAPEEIHRHRASCFGEVQAREAVAHEQVVPSARVKGGFFATDVQPVIAAASVDVGCAREATCIYRVAAIPASDHEVAGCCSKPFRRLV
jgi:hypothetical protein